MFSRAAVAIAAATALMCTHTLLPAAAEGYAATAPGRTTEVGQPLLSAFISDVPPMMSGVLQQRHKRVRGTSSYPRLLRRKTTAYPDDPLATRFPQARGPSSARINSEGLCRMVAIEAGEDRGNGSLAKVEMSVLQLPVLSGDDVAVVWFTACDLRTHDHDGLVAAASAARVVPVYVFDDQELAAESRLDASFAYYAVQSLRERLRAIGSDLVVRSGDAASEVSRVVSETGATHVFFHKSPVHALRRSHEQVAAALLNSRAEGDGDKSSPPLTVLSWSASQLTGVEDWDRSKVWNFRDFQEISSGEPARSCFPAPLSLPPLPGSVIPGTFPDLEDVLSRVGSSDAQVQKALSIASREEAPFGTLALCREGFGESRAISMADDYLSMGAIDFARSVFGPEDAPRTEQSEDMGLEMSATQRIVKARGYGGLAPGEVLARALGVALALGCLSPRRAYLARKLREKTSPRGFPPPWLAVGRGKCWLKELAVVESWHSLLAERDVTVGNTLRDGSMEDRYLRWHGWLVRYAVGGSEDPSDPALLLVHGFGASCDQWDEMFREFSPGRSPSSLSPSSSSSPSSAASGDAAHRGGVRLVALDLAGFGHSAKPPLSHSQYSWADCARDVALRAIGGPFFIAGNSIGGYISMGVAADCRELCRGVVLVNTAGRILKKEEFEEESSKKFEGLSVEAATRVGRLGPYSAPPNLALAALGTGLFAFLQGRIAETCRNVYPVNPAIVDEGLADNILRDSCDPGAVGVVVAGGKLPFSRSANEMLGKFGGPVLVTQGVKDPLNDAKGRAKLFESLGPHLDVVRLDGGHCPHHEIADQVSDAVWSFVKRVVEEERRQQQQQQQSSPLQSA